MDKEDVVHIHIYIYIYDGILLNHVKDEIMPFVTTWLDLEGVMLSKISQMKKDK